ncbi:MAG TPA: c-type cytochrome [Thermodesulfobacteriota bacterium]|nr:c-type cytochrome [Thermodesulfobacteriota bacterium]
MDKKFFTMCAILSVLFLLFSFKISRTTEQKGKGLTKQDLIKRGEYLVRFGGCNDCHTPKVLTPNGPVPDKTRLLSGYPSDSKMPTIDYSLVDTSKWVLFNYDLTAAVGPWGVAFAANLTPDKQTGIGLWTEEIFTNSMRTGKHMGAGRPILPPMPWFNLEHLEDKDLKAIFAYLQSLKPIKNLVPVPIPPSQLKTK